MTTEIDTHEDFDTIRMIEEGKDHLKGKNATTSFLPKKKKGGQIRKKIAYVPDREKKCLTEDQARYIYKMVEQNKAVNIHSMKQEIEDGKMVRNPPKEQESESELSPYQSAILNKKSKEDAKIEKMIK